MLYPAELRTLGGRELAQVTPAAQFFSLSPDQVYIRFCEVPRPRCGANATSPAAQIKNFSSSSTSGVKSRTPLNIRRAQSVQRAHFIQKVSS